ncbi:MAG: protein translocase subunit SecD [Opitutaceae bacterium]|nr:protein translocase subunit SecD [Opitutaceae bacterium]
MSGKNLWKIIFITVIAFWASLNLLPYKDTPLADYLQDEVVSTPEFADLLSRAEQLVESEESVSSIYVALKEIGAEEKIDLSEYFPEIKIENSLTNIKRRNELVLNELLRLSHSKLRFGLDLKGGVAFTLEIDESETVERSNIEREEDLSKAIEIIRIRVNAFGVTEPIIRAVGKNRIEVQLAGLSLKENPEVIDTLKKPARLDFKLVHPTLVPLSGSVNIPPPGYEVMELETERGNELQVEELYVKRIPELTGESVEKASPSSDEYGSLTVLLKFTGEGADRFADITQSIQNSNERTGRVGRLAIVLDGKLYSAPTVKTAIRGGRAEISGRFSQREAIDLANVLNNPLDVSLNVVEVNDVGPSLAEDSISSGLKASIIGAALVIGFMVFYFRVGGVVSLIALSVNLLVLLGVLSSIGATLTLPGIAGIVLTVGMAVDANILIFERIREELRAGKTLIASVHGGFEKVTSTILDANITTLITSGVMIVFGTGPVKGFGVTLAIGIFATVFSALIVNRLLMDLLVESGFLKKLSMASLIKQTSIDFLKYRKLAFSASWVIVAIGISVVVIKRDTIYGIDFIGGDEVTLSYQEKVDVSELRAAIEKHEVGEIIPVYHEPLGGGLPVLKVQTKSDQGGALIVALETEFESSDFQVIGQNHIGPVIGEEIRRNAFWAIGISLIGILLYVAFRFEFGYGIGAVVATVHDILMTIGLFVLLGYQFSAPMVAAILLIAGYSLNDTIVVFDRIREELSLNPTLTLRKVVNLAINKVLSRSLLTSFTTLLAAVSLFVFAGGVIEHISLTFIIGIVTGTFSSIFIASPVFYWWHKGDRHHVESSHDIKPKYDWEASSKASR